MSQSLLIATSNTGKFELHRRLFSELGFSGIPMQKMQDKEYQELPEQGTVLDRAHQKSHHYFEYLQSQKATIPAVILGIDEGILIKGQSFPDMKQLIPQLLSGRILRPQEELSITRAYSFIFSTERETKDLTITIPYVFLGDQGYFSPTDDLPLRFLVGLKGKTVPVSMSTTDEIAKYDAAYYQPLIPVLKRVIQL